MTSMPRVLMAVLAVALLSTDRALLGRQFNCHPNEFNCHPNEFNCHPNEGGRRPNIVFILIDDLGWADVGCFGSRYYETPNIDRLASQGMRFTDAYAACAVCSPTRASIMTGKYPARLHLTNWIPGEGDAPSHRLRIPEWRQFLPLEEITIAQALKSAGYVSASIGKWHLGGRPYYPEHHGFDLNVAGSYLGSPPSYFWPYQGRKQCRAGPEKGRPRRRVPHRPADR